MRRLRVGIAAGIVAGMLAPACGGPAASPVAPSAPGQGPQPPAPQAALTIRSDVTPPLGVSDFTPFVFDGSASTGADLIYFLDYGDGESSTQAVSSHVGSVESYGLRRTATLTVSDRFGRSDSVTQDYFVAAVQPSVLTWWSHRNADDYANRLYLRQDGATLSGLYTGPEMPSPGWPVAGTFTGDRSMHLRVNDGTIEYTGSVEWLPGQPVNMSQARVVLRLTARGGLADGETLVFRFVDPY